MCPTYQKRAIVERDINPCTTAFLFGRQHGRHLEMEASLKKRKGPPRITRRVRLENTLISRRLVAATVALRTNFDVRLLKVVSVDLRFAETDDFSQTGDNCSRRRTEFWKNRGVEPLLSNVFDRIEPLERKRTKNVTVEKMSAKENDNED
ncbi:unnamed protein product [Notodromas monacha]|uniref:Uncharacterized protein n=1 Tax=Notodromas monacha TaxID=399045 RepID=A0A7R9BKM7_9CRUS|nr:unnamed protein product [Notodromas monacha]CAG0917229.1 unnamed protein product [Notodromas monacha]